MEKLTVINCEVFLKGQVVMTQTGEGYGAGRKDHGFGDIEGVKVDVGR